MSEERLERLRWIIYDLRKEVEDLKRENTELRLENDSLQFRIDHKMQPRIDAIDRAYDNWATSPERGV